MFYRNVYRESWECGGWGRNKRSNATLIKEIGTCAPFWPWRVIFPPIVVPVRFWIVLFVRVA